MARDDNTAKFKVKLHIELTPVNRYGDQIGGGEIEFTRTLEVKNLVELGVYLERLNEKPFEYIQMVDPQPYTNNDAPITEPPF